jgi:hypothetical protein
MSVGEKAQSKCAEDEVSDATFRVALKVTCLAEASPWSAGYFYLTDCLSIST